jgi:hypothetical protein
MRRTRSILVLLVAGLACAMATSPASASAAASPALGGRAWNVPVIRLYDTTPPLYREGINIAIREWNAANVGVRFARTTNRRRAHVVVGAARYPGFVLGKATLGMTRGAWIRLDTALIATEHEQRGNTIYNLAEGAIPEQIASTMAHEMGHVLGLNHVRGCSVMTGANDLGIGTGNTCRDTPPTGMWSCRLIKPMDLRNATRRYGGRGVLKRARYCPLSATRAGVVRAIRSTPSTRTIAVKLDWRETTNTYGYAIARSAVGGGCPTTPDAGEKRFDVDSADHSEAWASPDAPTNGRYCFSVWSRNGRGTLTGPTRVFVDVAVPTTAPVTNFAAQAVGTTVQLSWASPAGTTQVRIWRYATDGTCRVPSGQFHSATAFGSATTASETDVGTGTWTYVALRSADADDAEAGNDGFTAFPSAPVCADVTVG